jgi:hypothetical protein
MPYVSMFFGIIIRMFYNDHNPPHFHADYQGTEGIFDFNGKMLQGNIRSNIAKNLIKKWTKLRREELVQNWINIEEKGIINKIEPLY